MKRRRTTLTSTASNRCVEADLLFEFRRTFGELPHCNRRMQAGDETRPLLVDAVTTGDRVLRGEPGGAGSGVRVTRSLPTPTMPAPDRLGTTPGYVEAPAVVVRGPRPAASPCSTSADS